MARSFNGSSQYASLNGGVFAMTGLPCTTAFWMYPNSTSGNQWPVYSQNMAATQINSSVILNYPSSGKVTGQTTDTVATSLPTATANFSASSWYHVAHSCGTGSTTIYLNGGNSAAQSASPTVTCDRCIRGASNLTSPGSYFNGRLAEVGFWTVALTADEVLTLSKGMSPLFVRPQSLVHYWPLRGSYSPEIEVMRAGGLTLTASPAFADHPAIFHPRPQAAHGLTPEMSDLQELKGASSFQEETRRKIFLPLASMPVAGLGWLIDRRNRVPVEEAKAKRKKRKTPHDPE